MISLGNDLRDPVEAVNLTYLSYRRTPNICA